MTNIIIVTITTTIATLTNTQVAQLANLYLTERSLVTHALELLSHSRLLDLLDALEEAYATLIDDLEESDRAQRYSWGPAHITIAVGVDTLYALLTYVRYLVWTNETETLSYWEETYGDLQPTSEDNRDHFRSLDNAGDLGLCDRCLRSNRRCNESHRQWKDSSWKSHRNTQYR
jgi:hypothetical protein